MTTQAQKIDALMERLDNLEEENASLVKAAATSNEHNDNNRGAVWKSKKKAKYALNGPLTVLCPECDTATKFLHCMYKVAGPDKKSKQPAYRSSIFIPDKSKLKS